MEVILEAKNEFTSQLCNLVSGNIYRGLKIIWLGSSNNFKLFQEKLAIVPKWNQDIINSEYHKIISKDENFDEDYLDKILEAVFVSNVKILSSIKSNAKNKFNIKIPSSKHFVHKCYIECARSLYIQPKLFYQNDINKVYEIIRISIQNAIRNLLPIKDILNQEESDENIDIDLSDSIENFSLSKPLTSEKYEKIEKEELESENEEQTISLFKPEEPEIEEPEIEEPEIEEPEIEEPEIEEPEIEEPEIEEPEIEEPETEVKKPKVLFRISPEEESEIENSTEEVFKLLLKKPKEEFFSDAESE